MTTATGSQTDSGSVKELAVPLAIIGIVLMMVLPLPRFLIDGLLAFSLAISIGAGR